MSLIKAKITVLTKDKKEIEVDYNPPEYSISRSATVAGEGANVKFTKVDHADFTVNLMFNTYEKGTDVRKKYKDIIELMIPTEEGKDTKQPPVCVFGWGDFTYKGFITKIDQKFTMFKGDGTPVRATLSVTFKNILTVEQESKMAGKDACRKVWVVKEGDRLDLIAEETMRDPALWREIVLENESLIPNPREFPGADHIGVSLIIPDIYNVAGELDG